VAANTSAPAREFDLEPADNLRLANLCGPLDENLRQLESRLDVQIRRRGGNFRVVGTRAAQAEDTLRELFDLADDHEVTPERVHLALSEHDSGMAPADAAKDESIVRVTRGGIRARGTHQREYLVQIRSRDLTFGIGPAGTGKTYLAVACAVEALQTDRVRRIILVRPAVEAGERLGFLPGDMYEKVHPYLRPLYDALYDMMEPDKAATMTERGAIEIAPLAYMRGRTLNDAFIVLDEAQNTTSEQMKMFLTRLGFNSRMVITGDITQVDLPSSRASGLIEIQSVLKSIAGIRFVYFTEKDVVRHELVSEIVRAYDEWSRRRET
jgi:phosphate starvation-inducible protein PhoH and related proteins